MASGTPPRSSASLPHRPGLGLCLATSVSGCAAARSRADDLARLAAGSPDDEVRLLLTREADSVGASSDEVAATWAPRFTRLRETYEGVEPELRSVACDAALTRYREGEPVFLTVLAIKSAACLGAG